MTDPFPLEDFDDWASTYDHDAKSQDFPFTGYNHTLDEVVKAATPKAGMTILDLGVGTGNLSERFLTCKCNVTGVDFSGEMIRIAKEKYPATSFIQADLRSNPASFLDARKFDRIVSAYTFHHFKLAEKYRILNNLTPFLKNSGFFVIADVAFQDDTALQTIRKSAGEVWEDEDYWLVDQSIPYFSRRELKISFMQTSICAGVFTMQSRLHS